MAVEPKSLLDVSIANLRALAAFFADEIGQCAESSQPPSPEARACKETLLTISVLIPKLQAARFLIADYTPPGRQCADCDDG